MRVWDNYLKQYHLSVFIFKAQRLRFFTSAAGQRLLRWMLYETKMSTTTSNVPRAQMRAR